MTSSVVVAVLAVPALLAVTAGCVLLMRAFARVKLLPEELALAVAWVFMVGGLVWLGVYLTESTLFGFGAPWSWLAAAHFAAAGFGALTVTALCCRVVSDPRALWILRTLLVVHPVAYLVAAGGIMGFRYSDEISAVAYEVIFVTQLAAVAFGRPDRMARGPRAVLFLALCVPVATLVPALAWAFQRPIFHLEAMIRYHGLVNAIGHVGLGLTALLWGRPPSHAAMKAP